MVDAESIKEIVNQVAMQAATEDMMPFRDTKNRNPGQLQYQSRGKIRGKGIKSCYLRSQDLKGMVRIQRKVAEC